MSNPHTHACTRSYTLYKLPHIFVVENKQVCRPPHTRTHARTPTHARAQFYECLNMASLYKLPHIFVVENNKWAIGMNHPRATAPTGGDDEPYIYKKGPAFGMPGIHVDGMDVVKVR
jgi:TPP-dependent pyruvate/acetoin dehydrogenase alpha subunit